MDTFVANNCVKKKCLKGTKIKISQDNIIKTHHAHQKKIQDQETKPCNIFCNFKAPNKAKKKSKKK